MKKIAKTDLLDDIQRVAEELGRAPTAKEYDALGQYSDMTARRRVGSWAEALNEIGLSCVVRGLISKKELISDIQRVAEEIDSSPTREEYRRLGEFSPETIYNRFDGWGSAMEAAGVEG